MLGRRRPDQELDNLPDDIQPGDYWKYVTADGTPIKSADPENLTHTIWGYSPPEIGGVAHLTKHTVREHEDGHISVRPNDGSSNSILVKGGPNMSRSWHGFIYHGIWTRV